MYVNRWLLFAASMLCNSTNGHASNNFLDGDPVLLTTTQFQQKYPGAFEGVRDDFNGELLSMLITRTGQVTFAGVNAYAVGRLFKNDTPCGAVASFSNFDKTGQVALIAEIERVNLLAAAEPVQVSGGGARRYYESAETWFSTDTITGDDRLTLIFTAVSKACGDNAARFFDALPRSHVMSRASDR